MNIIHILEEKNVKVTKNSTLGKVLRKQWEDHFAHHLSSKEKNKIYLSANSHSGAFLWHLYSYEKSECLEGKLAEAAFNQKDKSACYIFWQNNDEALIVEGADKLSSKDFANEYDVYVVDQKFNWTYINTHEVGHCGPYFARNANKLLDI